MDKKELETKSYALIAPCGCFHGATTASRPDAVKRFLQSIIEDTALEEGYIIQLVDEEEVRVKFGYCDGCRK